MYRSAWPIVVCLAAGAGCRGESPELRVLCEAIQSTNVEEVRRLLDQGGVDLGADQRSAGPRCRPFPLAMSRVGPDTPGQGSGDLEIVRLMLDKGADPNSCWLQGDESGERRGDRVSVGDFCGVQYASAARSVAFVQLLLDRGANVTRGAGAAALVSAAYEGHLAIVTLLAEAGAPVNEVAPSDDDRGSPHTALGAAVDGEHDEVIAYLAARPGAREFPRPNAALGVGNTISRFLRGQRAMDADEQAFLTAARRGDLRALDAALTAGVDVDRIDDYGMTALMRAAAWAPAPVVDRLLKAGAAPSLMSEGRTALHYAARRGRVDVIRTLAAAKADVNAPSPDTDETPLVAAVKAGQAEATSVLLDLGADSTAGDATMTVLEYAIYRADLEVVRALVRGGRTKVNARHRFAEESPLHRAVSCQHRGNNVELLQTLLWAGADQSAVDQKGETALQLAERKRAGETLPAYQACFDAQIAALRAGAP